MLLNSSGAGIKPVWVIIMITFALSLFNVISTQMHIADLSFIVDPLVDNDDAHPDPVYEDYAALNPFRDIKLDVNKKSAPPIYSSHQCVSAKDSSPSLDSVRFVTRTCKFHNLYYSPKDKIFHYYPSPSEQKLFVESKEEDYERMVSKMTVSLGNVFPRDSKDINKIPKGSVWHPEVSRFAKPPEHYAVISNPSNLALLLFQPFYSFNLGHFLWDDVLSIFSMLDIFGMQTFDQKRGQQTTKGTHDEGTIFPLPFYMEYNATGPGGNFADDPYYRCDARRHPDDMLETFEKRWRLCAKMYRRTFPFVMRYETHASGDIVRNGNWLKGMDAVKGLNYTASEGEQEWNQMPSDASLVLVPTVLAGSGRLGQIACEGDCGIGRASQFLSFREFLLGNILRPNYERIKKEKKKYPKGYITFSLPVGSTHPEMVSFFEDIIPYAKEIVGEDRVKVVDMANMTLSEEAELTMDTAILFVNHGGGSASSIFLPKDAAVILYAHGGCKKENGSMKWCEDGKNAHFDSIFYNSVSYIRPSWVEQDDRGDTEKIKNLLKMELTKTMESWGTIW